MGTSPDIDPGSAPFRTTEIGPLTRDRVEAFLTANGWTYGIDPDGDVGGQWDDNLFYFLRMGEAHEVLQVRGQWKQPVPLHREAELLRVLNQLNGDLVWPKLYVRAEDDALVVYSEVSTDLEHGVSDDQLGQLLACGLFTGLKAFEHLGDLLGLAPVASPEGHDAETVSR